MTKKTAHDPAAAVVVVDLAAAAAAADLIDSVVVVIAWPFQDPDQVQDEAFFRSLDLIQHPSAAGALA